MRRRLVLASTPLLFACALACGASSLGAPAAVRPATGSQEHPAPSPPVTVTLKDATLSDAAMRLAEEAGANIIVHRSLCLSGTGAAQVARETFEFKGRTLRDALREVCRRFGCRCYYGDGFYRILPVPGTEAGGASPDGLKRLLDGDPQRALALVTDATASVVGLMVDNGLYLASGGGLNDYPEAKFELSLSPLQEQAMWGRGLGMVGLRADQREYLFGALLQIHYGEASGALQNLGRLLEPPTAVDPPQIAGGTGPTFTGIAGGRSRYGSMRAIYDAISGRKEVGR